VKPLDRVRRAGAAFRKADEERQKAREELRGAVREAVKEGIPLTRVAEAGGITREAGRHLLRRSTSSRGV
jgi:hypothetical protein